MKIKKTLDLGITFGLIFCFIVLMKADNMVFRYIAFAGFIYLLKDVKGEE